MLKYFLQFNTVAKRIDLETLNIQQQLRTLLAVHILATILQIMGGNKFHKSGVHIP
jgi:hypothetical protein